MLFCEAYRYKDTVITEKAYGGRLRCHEIPSLVGADLNLPGQPQRSAVMGKGCFRDYIKKEIARTLLIQNAKLQAESGWYTAKFANPYRALHRGFIDEVILPSETTDKI